MKTVNFIFVSLFLKKVAWLQKKFYTFKLNFLFLTLIKIIENKKIIKIKAT